MIHGYCRNISLNTTIAIPLPVISLCIKFYQINGIITIALGGCGITLHNKHLESLMKEYNLDDNGRRLDDKSFIGNKYIRETAANNWIPRSIVIDLDPNNNININKWQSLNTNGYVFGQEGAEYNWAKGHYTEGGYVIDEVMDVFRKEVEVADEPQGVTYIHSIGGGTGSGLGSLLMMFIRNEYPKLKTTSFAVFPSPKVSDVVVEPYNAILALNEMSGTCDGVFVIDNEALYHLVKRVKPKYSDLNFLVNQIMADVSALFRYNDSCGFNLSSFLKTMVPYPNMKYFTTSRAPFYNKKFKSKSDTILKLTHQLFESSQLYTKSHIFNHINLATILLYRGYDDNNQNKSIVNKFKSQTHGIIFENDIVTTSISNKPLYQKQSATMIANSTGIMAVFKRISSKFTKMYKKKAFFHFYARAGMGVEFEFREADETVRNLINDYQTKEGV
eukprot:245906_1